MNIAVDIQPLCTESARRGMGVYTLNLLEEMFRQDSENKYILFNIYGDCCIDGRELPPNVEYFKLYPGAERYLLDYAFFQDSVGMQYEGLIEGIFQTFIREYEIDLFFITSPFDVYMTYNEKWFAGCLTACIFYDMVPWLFPESYLTDVGARMRYDSVLDFVTKTDLLLAISGCAKNDIVKYMEVAPERVKVIHAGVSSGFAATEFSAAQKSEVFAKYGIDSQYMLFPSGDDFRKNALGTVRAYAALKSETIAACQLVITGKSPEAEMADIRRILSEKGIEDRVIFSGHIPYEDLLLLYNNAKLVLFPSLYEGFGLPVIEAFKCGKNVVTSYNSSLGEVAEGAAVLVDPQSVADITRGIEQALQMEDFSAFDAVKAQRIAFYTWENSARLALEGINALKIKQAPAPKRMKIAYFSPLPPIDSKAAQRGEALLAELLAHCDVDIYVDGTYRTNRYIRVISHVAYPERAKSYDAAVFNLWNDEDCLYMLPHISGAGGVVIMNEESLHSAVLGACKNGKLPWSLYERMLREEVEDARHFMREVRQNPEFARVAVEEITLNRAVLDRADKIATGSAHMREKLLEKNVGYRVRVVEDLAELLDFVAEKGKKYIDDEDILHICEFEIPARELDFETEMPLVASTFSYVAKGGGK